MAKYLLLLMLFLSGCAMQGRRAETGGVPAYDGVTDMYPGEAGPLASATADNLAQRYPPGATALNLAKVKTPFGNALESALREKGFSVSFGGSGVGVGYTLDMFQGQTPPTCYLRVRTSDGDSFGTVRVMGVATGSPSSSPMPVKSPVQSMDLPQEPTQAVSETLPVAPSASAAPVSPAQPHPDRLMPGSGPRARPVQEVATSPARSDGVPVRIKATAARIAKRNRVPVADFCRWNGVTPETILEAGRRVQLRDPGLAVADATRPGASRQPEASPSAGHDDRQPKPLETPKPSASREHPKSAAPSPGPTSPSAVQTALAELTPSSASVGAPDTALPKPASEPVSIPVAEWAVEPGGVKRQMEEWAVRAKYRLIWRSKRDYVLETPARFAGSYEEAVKDLFTGLQRGGHALRVTIYQGNNVVEVAED